MTSQHLPSLEIGLIGVGLLGSALARRLHRHGYRLGMFDIDPAQLEPLVGAGVTGERSAEDTFAHWDRVILCLPNSDLAAALLRDVGHALRPDTFIIDTTTGRPDQMEQMARLVQQHGGQYVEATVAGSSQQLEAGQATLFLGGPQESLRRQQPLFDALADQSFVLGPVGAASRFKLVHNLLLGLHRAALAEALALGEAMGFPAGLALQVLGQTPAASAIMENKGPKMVQRDYQPQARLSQHLKDVRLIQELADNLHARVPLTEVHQRLLVEAEQSGWGDADNSAVIEVYRAGARDLRS